jgi:hypothetical protein
MKLERGAVEKGCLQPNLRPATFLGSETAPDGPQVRRRLHEMRAGSRRRKSYAKCGAAAGALLVVFLTQYAGMHVTRHSR